MEIGTVLPLAPSPRRSSGTDATAAVRPDGAHEFDGGRRPPPSDDDDATWARKMTPTPMKTIATVLFPWVKFMTAEVIASSPATSRRILRFRADNIVISSC